MAEKKVKKGNKYDAPFMKMSREMARRIADQHTPTDEDIKKAKKKKTAKK